MAPILPVSVPAVNRIVLPLVAPQRGPTARTSRRAARRAGVVTRLAAVVWHLVWR